METLGLKVNRLIRVAFGPFELSELENGKLQEVPTEELRAKLGPEIAAQAEADFEAPLVEHDTKKSLRHFGLRPQRRDPGIYNPRRRDKRTAAVMGFAHDARAPFRNNKGKRPRTK
jgi:23S rRNA pseudouridine2605 synthase